MSNVYFRRPLNQRVHECNDIELCLLGKRPIAGTLFAIQQSIYAAVIFLKRLVFHCDKQAVTNHEKLWFVQGRSTARKAAPVQVQFACLPSFSAPARAYNR
jgi:hypothetical protein